MASVWTVSEDMLTQRSDAATCGSKNSALTCGGYDGNVIALSESYNGTVWSSEGQLAAARSGHTCTGVLNDAKCMGGSDTGSSGNPPNPNGEEYNGTVWSVFSNWAQGAWSGSAGISDALVFGGNRGGGDPSSNNTYYYDGASWGYAADMNNGHPSTAGTGLGNDALASGSYQVGFGESYNGTVWTQLSAMNTPRSNCGLHGLSSKATVFGGKLSAGITETETTEDFDGVAWATSVDLNSAIAYNSGCGNATDSGLSCGGYFNGYKAITEVKEAVRENPGKHRAEIGINMPLEEGSPWIDSLAAMFEAWYEESGITDAEAVLGYELSPRERSNYALVGDAATGEIYALDMNTYTDANSPIRRTRRTQIINKNRVNVIHNRVEVEFEAGVGLNKTSTDDGYDPQATLKWSDDDGNTWSAGKTVSIGQFQQYGTRAVWRRLGKSRNRIYELTMEDPVKTVLVGTYAQIKACKF